jgi:hypothetical protein
MRGLDQDCRCPDRVSNTAATEYKSRASYLDQPVRYIRHYYYYYLVRKVLLPHLLSEALKIKICRLRGLQGRLTFLLM